MYDKTRGCRRAGRSYRYPSALVHWLYSLFALFVLSATSWATDLYGIHPGSDGASDAYLLIVDLEGFGPEISLDYFDSSGIQSEHQRKLLAPYGTFRVRLADFFGAEPGLVRLRSSSLVMGTYWRVAANGVSLSTPMTDGFETGVHYLLHEMAPRSDAYILLSGGSRNVECELICYGTQGEARVERRHVLESRVLEIPVSNLLSGATGMISLRPMGGRLFCYYYTRHPDHGIQTISLPLAAPEDTSVRIPRIPIGTADSLLIADISGIGTEIEITPEQGPQMISGIKRLLPPHGTISVHLSDFLGSKWRGMMKVAGQSRFLVQYVLQVQDHRDRIAVQESPSHLMGLSWPVWRPTQIKLSLWNMGEEVGTSSILLSQRHASSPLQRQEVLLGPGQLIDWSPEIHADWDSIILDSDTTQTHVLCVGFSGSRLLFASLLRGL